MNPVKQEHPEGCGLACAAMLSGRSYGDVATIAERLGIRAGDKRLYGSTEPLRRLLDALEVETGADETPFSSWEGLPDRALLATKWHLEEGHPLWHWVVFTRDGNGPCVLDPAPFLQEHRRTDLAQIQPRWFIEVSA